MQLASSGGRRLRHAALAARKLALEAERTVTRKELSAAARDAGKALDLRPAQRAVLSELVACWGEQEWDRLLVWPSNDYLMSRTGLTERAIRRILRQLIDLQLLAPKDSPNGKRYAVKDLAGQVVDAFGFDLTPIYARRGDWTVMLMEQKQLREVQKRAFDELTIALPIDGRVIVKGGVVFLAGGSPDDVRERWIAIAEQMGFDPRDVDVHLLPGVSNVRDLESRIRRDAEGATYGWSGSRSPCCAVQSQRNEAVR